MTVGNVASNSSEFRSVLRNVSFKQFKLGKHMWAGFENTMSILSLYTCGLFLIWLSLPIFIKHLTLKITRTRAGSWSSSSLIAASFLNITQVEVCVIERLERYIQCIQSVSSGSIYSCARFHARGSFLLMYMNPVFHRGVEILDIPHI